jgi:hypothetical protein
VAHKQVQTKELSAVKEVIRAAAEEKRKWTGEGDHYFWRLSKAEKQVFEIDPKRFPLMVMTYHAFEVFNGLVQGSDMDMKHEAAFLALKIARPDLLGKEYGIVAFRNFARALGQIGQSEAWQIWHRQDAWDYRGGVLIFDDKGQ